ncbi:MAG: phenylacetate--CoA ligase family protein, partial [Xanthobacteraceae bacterium]
MSDHFDALETRDPAQREREQFARLPGVIANALRGPGWAAHLAGVDPRKVSGRAALAKLPLLRKSDLPTLQRASPPFGGFNVISPREAKRLMVSPGPIFELEGQAEDVGGAARALHAAGIRKGD